MAIVQKFPCNDMVHRGVCGITWPNIIKRFETYNRAETEPRVPNVGLQERRNELFLKWSVPCSLCWDT